jgi:hypothetical protein
MKFGLCLLPFGVHSYVVLAARPKVFENRVLWRIFRPKMGLAVCIVSIATCRKLDSWGIKSWWEWDFLYWPDWPQGAPSLLYSEYWVFSRGKVTGAWCYHPPTCSSEVENGLELTLTFLLCLHRHVMGWRTIYCYDDQVKEDEMKQNM